MLKRNLFIAIVIFGLAIFTTQNAKSYYDCPDVFEDDCLATASWVTAWVQMTIPSYPNCTIDVKIQHKGCTDANGNARVATKILWWQVNSNDPNCTDLYDDFWVDLLSNWDQVLYEQILQELDQVISQYFADMYGLPGSSFYDCSGTTRFVEVVTSKAACYAPVYLVDFEQVFTGGDDWYAHLNVPCGDDVGCCAVSTEYCYDSNTGSMIETSTTTEYYPGSNNTCEGTLTPEELQWVIEDINDETGFNYTLLGVKPCIQTCEEE